MIYNLIVKKYFLLSLYILITTMIAFHHELWRDEVDVWLMARDVSSPKDFFAYLSNSGHPGLWHLILLPFAKLNFPAFTMQIVHLSIAIASVYLFLSYSPFPDYIKLLFVFSYFPLFEYSIISRNYGVGVLFLFATASFYTKRFEKPILYGSLVLFLCNTNLYCSILASGISFIYFLEIIQERKFEKNILIGFMIMVLGGLLLILQVLPNPETGEHKSIFANMKNFLAIPVSLLYSFSTGVSKFNFLILPSVFILPVAFRVFYKTKKPFFFLIWVMAILFLFYTFFYMRSYRHAGFVLFAFLFAYWIYYTYSERIISNSLILDIRKKEFYQSENILQVLFIFSLLISIQFSFQTAKKDFLYSFSNAKEMAEFIKKEKLDDIENKIATHSADSGKTVLFYLDSIHSFYFPASDRFGSFNPWDKKAWKGEEMEGEKAYAITMEKFKNVENVYYLASSALPEFTKGATLLYKTKNRNEFIKEEEFYLYKLDTATKEK
ncbi:MAG TPA: hypothetical protein PK079_02375 [Leptospiraceae bacterium]|nr:hypothetical protein [Leptospiraceae bacterium]HMX30940.1 hypothetical protein [Leptospiraceae bacterium]HMY30044.1 hypothetical protein [Leptospiraceae bacterium]HMZ62769.1 hypothetical protein [Leptospiraceae bacterium]HNA07352.1 hypothetical protein [Leptospiraceae bacterium]